MSSRVSTIARAVEIRRAVQPFLLHGIVDRAAWTRAAGADAAAWRLFLRVERCALPLSQLLQAHAGLPVGDGCRTALAPALQRELLPITVARTHLRRVARVAERLGIPVIVLKGGILALGDPIAMADVDVLLPKEEITRFSEGLARDRWESLPYHSDRVPQTVTDSGMPLELHQGTGLRGELDDAVWDRSELFADLPPLRRLGALDHLRHVAQHMSLDHSNRRVRLRDLYLLRRAAERCRREDLDALWAGRDASYVERTQRVTLDAVLSRAQDERLEKEALLNYVIATRSRLPMVGRDVEELVDALAVTMCHSTFETRKLLRGMHVVSDVPSSRAYVSAVERLAPPIGLALRHALRAGGAVLTRCLARCVLTQSRLHARKVQRALMT